LHPEGVHNIVNFVSHLLCCNCLCCIDCLFFGNLSGIIFESEAILSGVAADMKEVLGGLYSENNYPCTIEQLFFFFCWVVIMGSNQVAFPSIPSCHCIVTAFIVLIHQCTTFCLCFFSMHKCVEIKITCSRLPQYQSTVNPDSPFYDVSLVYPGHNGAYVQIASEMESD